MSKDDYIKGATSKIFNHTHKKAVQAELSDHILNIQDFNEEIGYDADTAENMAVEKMGDYEEVAENLGALHNDFYTPIGDIIAFVIWLAGLGGAYYLLKKYIFGDYGAMPITLAAVCLSCAVFFISAGIMLKRNRLPVMIGTFLCGGATSVFVHFCLNDLISQTNNNLYNLYELIVNSNIAVATSPKGNIVITIVSVLSIVMLLPIAVSIVYYIKYHTNNNTLFDNHIKKFFKGLSFIVSVVFIAFTVFFGYSFFTVQNDLYEEYKNAYQSTLTMCKECKTFDELSEYISSGKTGFIDDKNLFIYTKDDGTVKGYDYSHNLFTVYIEREFDVEYEEADYKFLNDYGLMPANFQTDYKYNATFSLTKQNIFKNALDSLSLKIYKVTYEKLDEITLFDMEEHSFDESMEFYLNHIPTSFTAYPARSNDNKSSYNFTYISGVGKSKYTDIMNMVNYPSYYEELKKQQTEISEIIKNNPDSSFEEIARLTNTKLIAPDVSYEDYSTVVSVLGSWFDDYKQDLLDAYDSQYKFEISDDFYFVLPNKSYDYVSFYSAKLSYIDIVPLKDMAKYSSFEREPYKKIKVFKKGYYAKNGLAYDYDDMPYFEEDGTRYRFYSIETDPGDMSGYIKVYYLVNNKGELYKADDCFINADGYLFIDTYHRLKVQDDGLTYSDANGNTYTKALETSWDENGNILPFDEYCD